MGLVREINSPGLGKEWPDLVVLLRIEPATGLDRQADPDRIGSEGLTFQTRVSQTFDGLAADEPERFLVVDADQALDDVIERVWEVVVARWLTSITT